jgi:prepilin-type N-terminal cleavage/methylation domain-containing protein
MNNRIGSRATATRHNGRHGFTLIELLVVIAIIAILAAILFPVFGTVMEGQRKARCKQNISELIIAAKKYKDETGKFPPALYGAAYNGGPLELYLGDARYNIRKENFTCPNAAPAVRNSSNLVAPINKMAPPGPAKDLAGRAMTFPEFDTYDFQYEPNSSTANPVLHYNLKWTPGLGISDDPRQLVSKDPPGETIVTYCLHHTNMDSNGVPAKGSKAIVGLLNGRVIEVDASKLYQWPGGATGNPWQATP